MLLFYHDIRINIRLDSWEVIWEYIDLDLLFRNPQKIKIIPCRCAISSGFPIGKMQQKHVDSSKSRSTSTLQILATQHVVCLGYNWGYPMYWAIICYTMAIILVVYPLINGTAILVLKKNAYPLYTIVIAYNPYISQYISYITIVIYPISHINPKYSQYMWASYGWPVDQTTMRRVRNRLATWRPPSDDHPGFVAPESSGNFMAIPCIYVS